MTEMFWWVFAACFVVAISFKVVEANAYRLNSIAQLPNVPVEKSYMGILLSIVAVITTVFLWAAFTE
ncbi:MAG TPA: hypothetical protein VIU46_09215 [Gallionellaceae bacterium]